MGISLEAYRLTIGLFAGGKPRKKKLHETGLHFSKGMLAFCVLTVLLLIAGIESNPGPYTTDEIMAKLIEMGADLKNGIAEVKTGLSNVQNEVDQMKNACEVLKVSFDDLKNSTDNITGKIDEIEQRLDDIDMQQEADKDTLDTLACENEKLRSTVQGLEQEVDELESRSRRENLRFFGLSESENDSHEQCTSTIVSTLNEFFTFKKWSPEDISRAHRVGSRQSTRNPRQLIAKFTRWSDVNSILQSREARERMKKDGLRISTDLTRRQIAQMKEAQANGKFAYFKKGRLVVEERRSTYGTDDTTNRGGHAVYSNSSHRGGRDGGPRTRSRTAGESAGAGAHGSHPPDPSRS